jgi:endonuclease G
LDPSWIGSTARQDDFRADATLPAGWYQVGSTSYSGSGYDRGHMCPSADRTASVADNSSTFLMTNMVPQAPNNNQGPWANMENYLRTLVTAGNELYIYSGGYGSQGTINAGHVNVPTRTWKVVVVIPQGSNDLSRVTSSTRVIAVDMPNSDALISRTADWKTFRVSIDAVEAATGYDFLSKVSASIQSTLESTVDTQ